MPKVLSDADYHPCVSYKMDFSMSNIQIAEELGIKRQTVGRILQQEATTGAPVEKIKGNKEKLNTGQL